MAVVEVIDTLKPKNGQEFSVAEAVDIAFNGEMTVKGKIDALQTQVDTLATDSEVATALELKANTSTVNTALALKANVSDVNTALSAKANASDVNTALASKANATDVTSALALKANTSDLAAKANTSTVNTALALKANVSDVNTALSAKANASDVNTALASKANATDVTSALALKANTSDLAAKANTSTVNTALALKANVSDVNTALSAKANASDVNTALALKADAGTYANGVSYLGTKATLAEIQAMSPQIAESAPKPQYFCTEDSHYYTWNGAIWGDNGTMNSAASEVEAARGGKDSLNLRLEAITSDLQNETDYDSGSALVSTWYNKATNNVLIPAGTDPSTDATRLLSTDTLAHAHIIAPGEIVVCSVESGYKYAVYAFDVTSRAMINIENSQSWMTVEQRFKVTQNAKIIIMVGKSDNSNISTINDMSNVSVIKKITLKGKTNTVATDLDAVKVEIGTKDNDFVSSWYNKSTNSTDIIYGAAPSDSTTRLLSTSTISNAQNLKAGEAIKCSVESGYKYAVYAFDATSRAMINIENSKSWKTSELTFETPEDAKVMIMVGKTDDAAISTSDGANITVKKASIKGHITTLANKVQNIPTPCVCDGAISLPAGYALPFDVYKLDGKYVADITPESLNTEATKVYIKQTENIGLGATEETAISLYQFKQNLTSGAYTATSFELIVVDKINLLSSKNTFDLIGTGNTSIVNITIRAKNDMSWLGVGTTKTWAYSDSDQIYSSAESSKVSDVVDLNSMNCFGMPKTYVKKTTVADVKTTKGTFCQVSNVIYVNPHLGNSINDIACLYGLDYASTDCGVISIRKNSAGNVIFKNIGFLMDSLMIQDAKTTDCNYWFFECKWHRGSQDAFGINGKYKAYLIDCIADYASKDNFNYHSSTKDSVAVEINCVSYGAGKHKLDTTGASTDQSSCNGSTAHNGITVMRFGCKYWGCEGSIVADVHNCRTLNVECSAKNVLSSISIQQYNAPYMLHDNRNASPGINQSYRTDTHNNYLIGCTGAGATYKYDVEGVSVIINDYVTNIDSQYVTSDSTVTQKENILY